LGLLILMGVGIGSGDGRKFGKTKITVSDLINTIAKDAEDAILGKIEGEPSYDGVVVFWDSNYVERVCQALEDDGFRAVFRKGDLTLPEVRLYSVHVDELFDSYRNSGCLVEDAN